MKDSQCWLYENTCRFEMEMEPDTELYKNPSLKEDKFLLRTALYWNRCCVYRTDGDEYVMRFISLVNGSNTHKKREDEYVLVRKEGFFIKLGGMLYVIISSDPELSVNIKDWSAGGSLQDNQWWPIWLIRASQRNVSWPTPGEINSSRWSMKYQPTR